MNIIRNIIGYVLIWLGIGAFLSMFIWDSPIKNKKDKFLRMFVYVPAIIIFWPLLLIFFSIMNLIEEWSCKARSDDDEN